MKQLKKFINTNYIKILKLLAAISLGSIVKFFIISYFEPDLKNLLEYLFVYIPAGLVTCVTYMCEVSSDTDNINYINNQGKNGTDITANYSLNNQGRDEISNNTNNSDNNQDRVRTGNHNDNRNRSPDILERENNILDAFRRVFTLASNQGRELIHMQATLDNSISLEAAHHEQLKQPNLPPQEVSRLQQQCQRLARQTATFTEQLNSKQREFSETTQELTRLQPEYTRIMMQEIHNDNE